LELKYHKYVLNTFLIISILNIINPVLINHYIIPRVLIYLIIFICIFTTLYYYRDKKFIFFENIIIREILIVYILLILLTLVSSYFILLSLIKLSYLFFVILLINLNLIASDYVRNFINNIIYTLIVLNLLSVCIFFLGFGHEVTYGNGFNGALNHPQALGILMAVLALFMLNKIKISKGINLIFYYVVFFLSLYLMIISRSRTAIIGFIIAIFISYIYQYIMERSRKFIIVLILLILVTYITSSSLFFEKNDGAQNLIDAYIKSRSILILPMLENISNNIFFGIGFGVDSSLSDSNVFYDPTFYLPLSGSVEKGNLILQLFEELGFFGFLIIAVASIKIVQFIPKSYQLRVRILFFIFLSNLGEATLVGVNGLGLILLLIMFSLIYYDPMTDEFR
jgi:hypothetical protein